MQTTRPKHLLSRALVAAALSLSSLTAFAFIDIPNPAPVVDLTGSLSDQQKQALTDKIQDLDARTGSEVEMLMLPSTDGETIQSYSWRVAQAWRPGHAGVNRGLVVVIAKNDHHSYIQVGRGLESIINNDVATSLAKNMSPFFRHGDFYGGLNQDLDDVASLIAANTPQTVQPAQASQDNTVLDAQTAPVAQQTASVIPVAGGNTSVQAHETGANVDGFTTFLKILFGLVGLLILVAIYRILRITSRSRKQAASLYSKSGVSGFSSASRPSSSRAINTNQSGAARPVTPPVTPVRPATPVTPASSTSSSVKAPVSTPTPSSAPASTSRTSNEALFGSDFQRNPVSPTKDSRRSSTGGTSKHSTSNRSEKTYNRSSSSLNRSSSPSRSTSSSDDGFAAGYVAGSMSSSSRASDNRRDDDNSASNSWNSSDTSSYSDPGGSYGGTGGGDTF